jgi:hypothetical protein
VKIPRKNSGLYRFYYLVVLFFYPTYNNNYITKYRINEGILLAKLPDAEKVIIDPEKLHNYILSITHPIGRFKAAFFKPLGYSAENREALEKSLRDLVISCDAREVEQTQYGKKFIVEGPILSPNGQIIQIVTVWVILKNERVPRFITAYPGVLR